MGLRNFFFLFILLPGMLLAQKPDALAKAFKNSGNDSAFALSRTGLPLRIFTVDNHYSRFEYWNALDSAAFSLAKGGVAGPFTQGDSLYYVKTVEVDSDIMMHAGQVFISPDRIGRDSALAIAERILKKTRNGTSFEKLCPSTYATQEEEVQCDLGWFVRGVMVTEFENAVLQHKKGEIFIVETRYGFHIVKVLDAAMRKRTSVRYELLSVKNK